MGLVTLVMALAVCGAWNRSNRILDDFDFGVWTCQCGLVSCDGELYCFAWRRNPPLWRWAHTDLPPERDYVLNAMRQARFFVKDGSGCKLDYWLIVLALTLVSAYLILWKPRKPFAPSPK